MSTRISLGDITIHRIIEEERPLFDPLTFFPGLDPALLAENRHWLEPHALDPKTGQLILCIQSYIVQTPHHNILIDTCVGNHKDRPGRDFWHMKDDPAYMRNLAAAGFRVEDIDYVMCTHLHVDHVGWNTKLENGRWVPTFPNARYVFSSDEYKYWEGENAKAQVNPFADSVLPIVEAKRADLVKNDFALDDMVRLESTPGHTPDHVAVQIGKLGNPAAVVTGDLIHSPLQARFPDISMRADYDMKQSAVTRRKFLECYCDTATLMCMAHFPSPSVGKLTRWGDGFKLKAEAV